MSRSLPRSFDHLIPCVRASVLSVAHNDLKYYAEDLIELENSDYEVRRFLVSSDGIEDVAVQKTLNALQWKKEMGIRDLQDDSFPGELWAIGSMFPYETDRDGRLTMHLRMKACISTRELAPIAKKFLAYLVWKLDRSAGEKGYTIVTDLRGISYRNCDMEMAKYTMTLDAIFPLGLRKVLAVDCPVLARVAWMALQLVVPKERRNMMSMVSRKQLLGFVDQENLPPYLGGCSRRKFCGPSVVPVGSPSFVDFASRKLDFTYEQTMKLWETYQPLMCEAEDLSREDSVIM